MSTSCYIFSSHSSVNNVQVFPDVTKCHLVYSYGRIDVSHYVSCFETSEIAYTNIRRKKINLQMHANHKTSFKVEGNNL
jgi:hypothetical protein